MTMQCEDARPLVPSYLDGELSEAQAAPLRKHLLDCQPCRASAQGEKNLKRWFAPGAEIAVPAGFAARVARRAFAGDAGSGSTEPGGAGILIPAVAPRSATRNEPTPLLPFVLRLTAIAAVLLVFLSVAIGNLRLPKVRDVAATNEHELTLDDALDELNRLNAAQPAAAGADSDDEEGVLEVESPARKR